MREKEFPHRRECLHKRVSNRGAAHSLAGEDEQRDSGSDRGGRLRVPIADSLVLGENCPAAASDFRQLYLVRCVLREVVVVNFDENPCDSQGASYDVPPEASIDEEDLAHAARRRFSQRMASSIERRSIS